MRQWALPWLGVYVLLLLSSAGCIYGDESAVDVVDLVDDSPVTSTDNDAKKSRSFVEPAHGSATELTLTTYLTDAAHLHYVVLLTGHTPLDAAAIKSAAEQCRQQVSQEVQLPVNPTTRRLPGRSNAVEPIRAVSAVEANTVTVQTAEKVVTAVENLKPNTSYDVYFVAEVIGSNGVFGPVQSVLQSLTHPEPPVVEITSVRPANASSDTVVMNATFTAPGNVYFALVPSGKEDSDLVISREDLVANRSTGVSGTVGQVAFAVQTAAMGTGTFDFQKIVTNLSPATMYDVFMMTEAPGYGEVRSEVIRKPRAVRTHALAPELTSMKCSPLNASATALVVSYQFEIDRNDLQRVALETLSYFSYDFHYEVTALSDDSQDKASDMSSATAVGRVKGSVGDISALKPAAGRGIFSTRNFSTVEEFRASLKETHRANISGLKSGTLYKVNLRVETAGSQGLFGLRELTAQATTHQEAPTILGAAPQSTNKSVSSLTLTVELARPTGNIHYLISRNNEPALSLRSVFQQATSMENLQNLIRDRLPRDSENGAYQIGVFQFLSNNESTGAVNSSRITDRRNPVGDGDVAAFKQEFEIAGLMDATSYSIALLPETSKSFGLFGRAFSTLLEAATNEHASQVELRSVEPLLGDVSGIQLEVNMSKPQDVLFMCLSQHDDTVSTENMEQCREVEERSSFEFSRGSQNIFTFNIGNLTEDTPYTVSMYAENARRNGVFSNRSKVVPVRTHKNAPSIIDLSAQPVPATTSQVAANVMVESNSPCLLHYAIRETVDAVETGKEEHSPVDAATITKYSTESNTRFQQQRIPSSSSSSVFVKGGNIFTDSNLTNGFTIEDLNANTTYELFVVTETSRDGNSSGVFGEPTLCNVTTHAPAPKISLATVDPVPGSIDSVFISANLSHPGVVHYFLTDVDFADPAVISHGDQNYTPHELRGQFTILENHILMEVINGTNDTRPTDPPVFVHNITVGGLKSGATYHVSLTTETNGSGGVFGEFPPPVLVNTNLGPPTLIPEKLSVHAVAGSSSSLSIDFQLDRFGEVHYALFFRGLIHDRSQSANASQAQISTNEDKNLSAPVWPPPISTFDLSHLNGSVLKAASFEELGVGVWVNDTISVSREDITRDKTAHKEIDKLPPNALFDVCLVTETAASGGILGWPASGNVDACHRVATHADYTNQSVMLDEIAVSPLDGRTDGIHVTLNVSKLLKAPQVTGGIGSNVLDRFSEATGRIPYFILFDTKLKHGRDLVGSSFVSHRGEVTHAFKEATTGRGDGVIAAGMLTNITAENATALQIKQDVFGLHANHEYLLFFAYETSGSDGVFTRVNPHKNRSNESRSENDGILVKTHEEPPRISKAKAHPTFGSSSMVSVKFDVACDSCTSVLIYLLIFPDQCKTPISVVDALHLDRFSTVERNFTVATKGGKGDCKTPLVQKRVELEMSERQHHRNDIEEELGDDGILAPNSSYFVLLATETVGSQGVLSKKFQDPLRVRTHALAPKFTEIQLEPRVGSTTELVLKVALDRPSEVHYMLGASSNVDFSVTSPHNISSKSTSDNRRGHDKSVHDYPHDVVRMRRTVTYSGGQHIELLDYLPPGTRFNLFIVSEALPADHGVYGAIGEVRDVSTFANAPILLAHAAYPTPGTTRALTVGFRMDAPGIVYFSVVAVQPWSTAHHVAKGSDRYGNRLALEDRLVAQKSFEVDEMSMESEHDSGWKEQILEVPQTELNYTVHLVTETKDSGGIYGTVASHAGVRAHSEAPEILDVFVTPTDARVDALTVNVTLSDRGHVHYIALPSGRALSPPSDDTPQHSTELAILASGSVDINETAGNDQKAGFVITGLTEGKAYDLYFRSETLGSFGVFGAWTRDAVTTRTHGLPPDVLPDAVGCNLLPTCEQRGRKPCSRKANVCGDCLDGYSTASDEESADGNNAACVKLPTTNKGPRGAKIKINGVKRNPKLSQPESESQHASMQEPQQQSASNLGNDQPKAAEEESQSPIKPEVVDEHGQQESETPSEQREAAQQTPHDAAPENDAKQDNIAATSSQSTSDPVPNDPELSKLLDLNQPIWTHEALEQSELTELTQGVKHVPEGPPK